MVAERKAGRRALGVLVPSDDNGGTRPYRISDLSWDKEHQYLITSNNGSSAHVAVKQPSWYVDPIEKLEYVDTLPPDFVGSMLTEEQRSVASTVRDLDEQAVIRVDVIDTDGSVTSRFLSHEFNTPEPHRGFRSEFSESSAASFKAVRSDDPRNFKDAMSRPDRNQWVEARFAELHNLKDSWHWVDHLDTHRPVRVITVWTLKRLADGSVDRYKVRMVLDCSRMTKADVGQTFQHVGEMDTLRFMCATSAQFDLMMMQNDVDKAFLEGQAPTVLHSYPPEGVVSPMGRNGRKKILEVTGNVYGRLDAPRVYGRCYDDHLLTFPEIDDQGNRTKLHRGTADHSTWHFERLCADGTVCKLDMLVYVDDSLSLFKPDSYGWQLYNDVQCHIDSRFKLKRDSHGNYGKEAASFLGCDVHHDWENRTVSLGLPGKVQHALEVGGMEDCNPKDTPGVPNTYLTADDCPRNGGEPCPPDCNYAGVVGSLLWISRMVRPDLMQRTVELAKFMHDPGEVHWHAAKHALAYLKRTQDERIVYKHDPNVTEKNYGFKMHVDANYAPNDGNPERKLHSTTGYIATQNNVSVAHRSRRQAILADSSSAAEFIAAAECAKFVVWFRRLYADFGFPQMEPTVCFEDNTSCSKLVENYCGHDRVKHLDIRVAVVRELHEKGAFVMQNIPDKDQLADVFTKVKPGPQTTRMRNWMLHGEVPDDCFHRKDLFEQPLGVAG